MTLIYSRPMTVIATEDLDLLRTEIAELQARGAGKCAWSEEADYEYWSSSCGLLWTLINGSPADNGMTFCPRCGRRIAEADAAS